MQCRDSCFAPCVREVVEVDADFDTTIKEGEQPVHRSGERGLQTEIGESLKQVRNRLYPRTPGFVASQSTDPAPRLSPAINGDPTSSPSRTPSVGGEFVDW